MNKNLLESCTPEQTGQLRWHQPAAIEPLPAGGIRIKAPARCDYFRDPAGKPAINSAPFLFLEAEGDFVAKTHVSHSFLTKWDAAALMALSDDGHWCKLCFEGSDFGTRAIVSVVTRDVSDDANGVNYHWRDVWLQIVRVGNLFAMHYGPDGTQWNMVRYFRLDLPAKIKVGLVAQCPAGEGADIDFHTFQLEHRTIADARAGI
jgi:uncharacterized protein